MLLLTGCLLVGGCSVNPATGKKQLILISQGQEIAMGQEAAPQFEKESGGKVPSERLQAYVQMVGGKIAAVSDRKMPYEYILVASDTPNAFALPGGKIFITAGLMIRMTNERQLAAVLGHETGHVAAKHNISNIQRQMGAAVLVDIAAGVAGSNRAEAAKAVTKTVTAMGNLKYSRDDEHEADKIGIRYITAAGYSPWGAVELLNVLKGLSESEPGSLTEMFQTHPVTSKRIARAKEIIQGDPQYSRFSSSMPDPKADHFAKMHKLLVRTLAKSK